MKEKLNFRHTRNEIVQGSENFIKPCPVRMNILSNDIC